MKKLLLLTSAFFCVFLSSAQFLPEIRFDGKHSFQTSGTPQNPNSILGIHDVISGTGTSGNSRAPQGSQRYIRTVYLITAAEMLNAAVPPGATFSQIGFNYSAAQSITTASTTFKVYFENTSDATYNKASTLWSDVIAPMTNAHDGNITIPNAAGNFDINIVGGSPFTYTGGGLYIAYEYQNTTNPVSTANTANCNTDLTNGLRNAFSTSALPTSVTNTSSFRPFTRLAYTLNNDAGVIQVYTLGKLPIPYAAPHIISANIKNNGDNPITNLNVTLNVTGANTFTNTQNIASLASGANATVSFTSFTPTVTGTNTITVTIPNTDDIAGNNTKTVSQSVTNNSYTYAYGTVASGGVGFTGNTGDFVAKFSTSSPTTVNQVSVNFSTGGQPFQIGIWDATGTGGTPGANLWTSTSQTSTAGAFTLPVSPPVAVSGNFYVGVRQTGTTNVSFAFQTESPIRPTTFYYASPTGSTTWTDFSPGSPYKFMVEPRLTLANDVGASALTNPLGGSTVRICGAITPKCNISNYGSANQSFNATFEVKQGATVIYTSTKPVVLNSGVTQEVSFDPYTPTAGSYTANCFTSLSGDGDPSNDLVTASFSAAIVDYGGGAPANGNYTFLNSTSCSAPASPVQPVYSWIDPVAAGHTSITFTDPDDGVFSVDPGFNFPYMGTTFNTGSPYLNIYVNGFLNLGTPVTGTQTGVTAIPSALNPANLIAAGMVDLDITPATYPNAKIYYGGDATKFVITYYHAYRFSATTSTDYLTMQVILYTNGKIVVQYNDAETINPLTIFAAQCDLGIQNAAGTAGIQYRIDNAGGPMFSSPLALEYRPQGVVPVNLLNFTAQRSGKINLLSWSTSQEQNSSHFVVERSNDSRSFVAIGQVTAAGFSNIVSNYSFTDNNPVKGINYYRLRSVDKDNSAKNSLIRSVRNDGIADVAIYPNPVLDVLKVSVSADKNVTGEIQVSDVSGKVLYTKQVKIVQGNNTLPVNVSNFAKGTYLIKVQLGDDIIVNKFTKL